MLKSKSAPLCRLKKNTKWKFRAQIQLPACRSLMISSTDIMNAIQEELKEIIGGV